MNLIYKLQGTLDLLILKAIFPLAENITAYGLETIATGEFLRAREENVLKK